MTNYFQLEIVTPQKIIYKDKAVSISLIGTQGSLGILANHAPLVTVLSQGPVSIKKLDGTVSTMELSGGFVEVSNNQVNLLADQVKQVELV